MTLYVKKDLLDKFLKDMYVDLNAEVIHNRVFMWSLCS
jgi:hypothetical protein